MDTSGKTQWETKGVFILFILLCLATLVDIVPGIDGASWATRLYGPICLLGVIFCSREKSNYMMVDAFVQMYPKGLQKALAIICHVMMLVCFVLLEISVVVSFIQAIGAGFSTVDEIFNVVLYVISIIVYPISFVYMAFQIKTDVKED